MYAWERAALGIDSLGGIQGAIDTEMRLEIAGPNRTAWWIATLFGPDFWTHWRVGLLRPTLIGTTDVPVAPPDPLILSWPKHLGQRTELIPTPTDKIAVSPAIVAGRALAFGVMGVTSDELSSGTLEPDSHWILVSPTDLVKRLQLHDEDRVRVQLLASSYRADPPHGH